ncbi:MAG: hypothetical protein H6Q89_5511 [Myxococcaceae bacterium]|nr:hypothetical protein [Myxococcaceae bacterium]
MPLQPQLRPVPQRDGRMAPAPLPAVRENRPLPTPPLEQKLHHGYRGHQGRYWGHQHNHWDQRHRGGYPYWYFRSFDYPLSYGYFPYPYSLWDDAYGIYGFNARYPYFHFYLAPGIQIGLPPLGFGYYYDLYWRPTDSVYIYQPQVIEEDRPVKARLWAERLDGAVRLTWADPQGRVPRRVDLFLADQNQTVLAVQTFTHEPYVALFSPQPETAYVGVTVEWANGSISTALLPYTF